MAQLVHGNALHIHRVDVAGGLSSMNPIAVGMIMLGAVILVLGVRIAAKRHISAGVAVSLLGIATAVAPFVITFVLFR